MGDATESDASLRWNPVWSPAKADLVKDFPGYDPQQMSTDGRVSTGLRPNLAEFHPEQNGKVGTTLYSPVINISEALCRITSYLVGKKRGDR